MTDTIDLSASAVSDRLQGLGRGDVGPDAVERDARILWSALIEPGDRVAGALIRALGARAALEVVQSPSAGATAGLDPAELTAATRRWRPRFAAALHAAHDARRCGASVLIPGDDAWPERVDALGDHAPPCLWVRGDASALSAARTVSIVGARASTAYGEQVTGELAAPLASDGTVIVSGGAYGIDGAAHRATLAAGGVTVAWLAGGVDRAYPAGHARLLEAITTRGGLVVSDVPCGGAPTRWRFLARNRLIAASGDATVVVEAGWRSGSLNTAGHAATLGRPLGAVPGAITSATSAGCHRLLREYDAQCITSASDVRELVGWVDGNDDVDPRLRAVRDALPWRGALDEGEVAVAAGVPLADARAMLALWELEGAVARDGSRWRRTS